MNKEVKISVITVTYNSEAFLEETILSVINQKYKNIEYIIIDGGSKDNTLNIIKKYEHKLTYWSSEPDESMYDAINKGLRFVSGDLCICLNSDDVLFNDNVFSIVVEKYLQTAGKYGAYFGDVVIKRGDKHRKIRLFDIDFDILLSSKHCTFLPQPATFIIREAIAKVGLFDKQYRFASDYDYLLRLLLQYKVMHIKSCFTVFRAHEESITSTQSNKMNAERLHIIENNRKNISNSLYFKVLGGLYWIKYIFCNKPNRYV
ncbi:glycosyltransferase family 2 protein [Pedobacter sp. KR3-3]|uniref:Glycosyltransferase family 2 protein n=1 Tax=Pedobacter albus TaxID=3113905 RepID=A0ABU7IBX2_9SPHI|nr:glycosyltransferase family 2 protein [Pedobacter sp. KR3-3]MEE1946849.1 glycosyltransferase family 2 protein [Pedobacter sp. KR3-3]